MTEWISVVDNLPPLENQEYFSERVLICEDDDICIGYICWDDCIFNDDMDLDITCSLNAALNYGWGFWESEDGHRDNINTSHWMPLPKPPEKKHVRPGKMTPQGIEP